MDAATLLPIFARLEQAVSPLRFTPPVTHVYNPLSYAQEPFRLYVEKYLAGPPGRTFLLGMNPGPWGMAQTGVPFGEVAAVRDWLGISCAVGQPETVHPARPIDGFACRRSEVSGRRVWGLFSSWYPSADEFAQHFLVVNYCPLVFMEDSGRNRTPDRLPRAERDTLYAVCDHALGELLKALQVGQTIGVGRFAEERLKTVTSRYGLQIPVSSILHPSPANPKANADWEGSVSPTLKGALL